MIRLFLQKFLVCLLVLAFSSVAWAQAGEDIGSEEIPDEGILDDATLEIEDTFEGSPVEALDDLEEFMVTKELEGEIKEVNDDFIVVRVEGGKELQLVADAETLIYVNDEKSNLGDIQAGDEIFAYYVEESGILKCDWIEITR